MPEPPPNPVLTLDESERGEMLVGTCKACGGLVYEYPIKWVKPNRPCYLEYRLVMVQHHRGCCPGKPKDL